MTNAHSWLIYELFVPVLEVVDELARAANEGEAADHFGCDARQHWRSVVQSLGKANSVQVSGRDVADAIRTIAAINEDAGTSDDLASYLYRRRDALRQAAENGWTAAKQGGTIPADPFPVP